MASLNIEVTNFLNKTEKKTVETIFFAENAGATAVEKHVFDFAKDDWQNLPNQLETYSIGILGLNIWDISQIIYNISLILLFTVFITFIFHCLIELIEYITCRNQNCVLD